MASAGVPLDQQQVTEAGPLGKERTLPALHPDRAEQRCFLPYQPPPEDGAPAELEEFLELAKFIMEDLEWLLALPHDKFWCQVVFDESLQKCLDSYLRGAPRGLDLAAAPCSPAVAEAQRAVHRAAFLTFLRMATHKESKEHFLSPAAFGEIVYDNFLFDVPKMLDLCALFGGGNAPLLHRMMDNVFAQQPAYYSDLQETLPAVLQVFDTILEKCGLHCDGAAAMEPLKLTAHSRASAMTMTQQDFVDVILYLCDSASTVHAFLDVFPAACSSFQSHGFLSRLTCFYEAAVADLENAVRRRSFDDLSLQQHLWDRLSHSCRKMVETSHLLLHHTCLQPILEGRENMQTFAEELLQHFTSFLPEKRFLCDYDEQFPVADDLGLLQQALPLLDETRTSYLLQGVASARDGAGRRRRRPASRAAGPASRLRSPGRGGGGGGASAAEPGGAAAMTEAPGRGNNGAACPLSGAELESLLSAIRDLLPDLGDGFLLACLHRYRYDPELVVHHILEDRLEPGLESLDRTLPRPVKDELPPVLDSRSNVFDDDEFDVFRRDQVDMSRVWKGRRKGEDARDLLNDKRHVDQQRSRYQAYQTVEDQEVLQPGDEDAYEDEYDDTYDMNQVGANDLDGDSLLSRRPFTVPRVLRTAARAEPEEEEEEEEEEPTQSDRTRDQFVQDPALLRDRAEARRAALQQRRGVRPERQANVGGRPRGQGQTPETLLDRRRKEANKSRVGNHNRRGMADSKRNKGMVPS